MTALGVCRMPPPPLPCSCDVVGAYRFVVCPLPSPLRVVGVLLGLEGLSCVPFLRAWRV